ncbi:MAG: response regulator [Myxococcales bacterium]|nr:response regulator [Myxococcales bacterium]
MSQRATKGMHLLLVEDSPADAKLVLHALKQAGHVVECERVEDATAMREALARKPWDLVISDWAMPQFSALAALDVLKESGLDLPFIIVSGTVGEELAVQAMRAGAHDYVLKDRLTRLAPVIERELKEQADRAAHRSGEAARRASEARFARLAESGVIGIVVSDAAGTIVEANDPFLRFLGFSREELVGGHLRERDLTPPEWLAVTDQALETLRASGVAAPYEKELARKDGSRVWVLVGIAKLDEDQSISFMVDVTAQKRAEAALVRSQEQLRHAQKMEAVGRLAGGVAHDFNNLLSVILSYSEMIGECLPEGDPCREDAAEIARAGKRAADLTQQLLMFSRQEVAQAKVLDLNELLTKLDKMLHRLLGEDVELTCKRSADLYRVRADPSHLEQVVMNLVVNSRDAMPQGGKLAIETSNVVLDEAYAREHHGVVPGRYVMLTVSDTGHGIDAATQARIFEPFYTTKPKGKGTGLGLSTVFGIVQQCGGSIRVESAGKGGTTFRVYLPEVDALTDPEEEPREPARLSGTETVLLVEDEDQIRTVERVILRDLGYDVIEARNGPEALMLCEAHVGTIHLLLTDVVMPQMSGPELATRVLLLRPAIKILCMSGYTDDALLRYGASDSGMAYLQKPITPDKLARKVRAVLDGR